MSIADKYFFHFLHKNPHKSTLFAIYAVTSAVPQANDACFKAIAAFIALMFSAVRSIIMS